MFLHHLRSAVRSILHRKLYSAIAALSLAIGLAVSMLILSFVRFENGFDTQHHDSASIYRLNWRTPDGSHFATFMNPMSPLLTSALPEIESFTRLARTQHLFTVGDVDQYQQLSMVDEDFFSFFNYPVVAGDPEAAIRDISSAVITEAASQQLFGDPAAIGQSFTVDGTHSFRVAAIIGNNAGDSHLTSNIYVNNETLPVLWNYPAVWTNMGSDSMYHYVRLAADADPQAVEANAMDLVRQNDPSASFSILLQPLQEIHFTPDLQNEMDMRDDITGQVKPLRARSDILVFSGVGLLTLFIAACNFMNLQLVQVTRRRREIGIRRVAGASNSELIACFLIETSLIAGIALILALLLCEFLLPSFSAMVAGSMAASTFITLPNVMLMAVIALGIGILAGAWPALTAARMSPALALKGELVKGKTRAQFRSSLIIAQFSISIGLIIACGIVNMQIEYAMQKSLGFDPNDVVTIELRNNQMRGAYDVLRDSLLMEPGVVSVSGASIIPTRDLSDGTGLVLAGGDPSSPQALRMVMVSEDYFATLGMPLLGGRALSEDFATDHSAGFSATVQTQIGGAILNATAARAFGFADPAAAVGADLYSEGMFQGLLYRSDFNVVGVVADAHFQSVRSDIAPVIFLLQDMRNVMIVKLAADADESVLAAIDRLWQQQIPEFPIQRAFLQDSYSAFYSSENRTFALFVGLSAVAIMVACLGLYALAAFVAERRTKEISIRKVLGATVASIARLLAWDFSRLVLLANLIAWPLAWWAMQQWLANFAYRTDIHIGIFLFAGLATFVMAMATTFQRAYSVATSNPITALRTE